MSKETRWLLIFAGIFLVVGLVASLLIGVYMDDRRDEKLLRDYKDLFPTAEKVEVKTLKGDILTGSYKFKDNNGQNLGTVYLGGGVAKGIYYYALGNNEEYDKNEEYKFSIKVTINPEDEILNVQVDESEHTPDFVEIVEQYFAKLKGEKLIQYKFIDEIAGASSFTMPVVRDVLTAVVKAHLDKDPLPKPEVTVEPHEAIFGEGTVYEEDDEFTPTEIVTNKGIIKDEIGNIIGNTYTGKVSTDIIPGKANADLILLVGVNLKGQIAGVVTILSEHTPGYYGDYRDSLSGLVEIDPENLNVDSIAGSTVSGGLINQILNAIKAIIADEPPIVELTNYEKIFGEGAVEVADYDTSVIRTIEVVDGSVDSEVFVTKEKIYDEENNLIGYAYTGRVNTDLIPYKASADLILLVGVNLEGKVLGVITVLSEHTAGFYATWVDSIADLKDINLEGLKVDGISGATISRGFINGIFEGIKEVITNE